MKELAPIVLITPNTDTFTNPTLVALFHSLKKDKRIVLLVGPTQQISSLSNLPNVKFIPIQLKLFLWNNPLRFFFQFKEYLKIRRLIKSQGTSTLLAVDPLGLIWAGRIKKFFFPKIHLSYLSFEIFFKKELSGYYLKLKNKEIYYSTLIDSLLIQDETRKNLLLQENKINLLEDKIALVPVSPMYIPVENKKDIHEILHIARDKKLAVYSGSVGEWCGTKALIEAFNKGYWNQEYHLVFHTRKPISKGDEFYEDLISLNENENIPFTLHPYPFDTFEELAVFLSGFDLAFALYYPNNDNPYYGKNMQEIGLSSGKFSTYMMLDLPTIVTACNTYNNLIKDYAFGAVLNNIEVLADLMDGLKGNKKESFKLYQHLLNPEKSIQAYLKVLP